MLVRRDIAVRQFTLHELDSLMGRHVLVCSIDVDGEPMLVSTVHLESLHSTAVRCPVRVEQGAVGRGAQC